MGTMQKPLKEIKKLDHIDKVYKMSIFPSGKLISVSYDCIIKIWNTDFALIQKISNSHDNLIIFCISIKDENNFATCSFRNINIFSYNVIQYDLKETIYNAHNGYIYKILFCSDKKIISCSTDKTLKIWKETKQLNKYQCVTILSHNNFVKSFIYFEDRKILVSGGLDSTRIWDLKEYKLDGIIYAKCYWWNAFDNIDDDRIIIGSEYDDYMKVISISQRKIIKEIKNDFPCLAVLVAKKEEVFIIGGQSKEIKVYRIDNYECIQIIKKAHINHIIGFTQFDNGQIASYSHDMLKIWRFEEGYLYNYK